MKELLSSNETHEKHPPDALWFNESSALLAPNGEVSRYKDNLVLAKFLRTESFLAWFGDWINDPQNASVAVYEDTAEPVLFFHRSRLELGKDTKLSIEHDKTFGKKYGLIKKALYFTTSNLLEYGPHIHKVFLNLRNPAKEWLAATEINDGVFVVGEDRGKDFYQACTFSEFNVTHYQTMGIGAGCIQRWSRN